MRKLLFLFLLLVILSVWYKAVLKQKHIAHHAQETSIERKLKGPFTVGEKCTYVIAWKGVPVGRATATIEELKKFKNFDVYKIKVIAKTNDFLSVFFKIEDTFTSYVDRDTLISRHYESTIREGSYKKDLIVDYDLEKSIAIYRNLQDGSRKTCPVEKNVHDSVSAAYYFRTIPLEVGDNIKIIVNQSEKNYEMVGNVEKLSDVDIPNMGVFGTFLIKAYRKLDGKKMKQADSWGYISADDKRLILYVNVKVLAIPWIGEVTATLEKVEYISPAKN